MKHKILLAVLALIFILSFTGCGKDYKEVAISDQTKIAGMQKYAKEQLKQYFGIDVDMGEEKVAKAYENIPKDGVKGQKTYVIIARRYEQAKEGEIYSYQLIMNEQSEVVGLFYGCNENVENRVLLVNGDIDEICQEFIKSNKIIDAGYVATQTKVEDVYKNDTVQTVIYSYADSNGNHKGDILFSIDLVKKAVVGFEVAKDDNQTAK